MNNRKFCLTYIKNILEALCSTCKKFSNEPMIEYRKSNSIHYLCTSCFKKNEKYKNIFNVPIKTCMGSYFKEEK